jgi:hypothetical protein
VTKRNKATVVLTLTLFQTPTRAVHSEGEGGQAGATAPQGKLYLRFLECHIDYSLDIWDFFGIYIGLLPPGEKILHAYGPDTNSNPNPVPNRTEKSFDEMSF